MAHHEAEGWTTRFYRKIMNPLILNAKRRWMFLGGVVVLLLAAVAFVPLKWVRVKMLPFDNKSEFQVIVDMPNGTPLEETARVTQLLAGETQKQPEDQCSDLCRNGVALQFQRAGPTLLPPARSQCGRHSGESVAQERAEAPEP